MKLTQDDIKYVIHEATRIVNESLMVNDSDEEELCEEESASTQDSTSGKSVADTIKASNTAYNQYKANNPIGKKIVDFIKKKTKEPKAQPGTRPAIQGQKKTPTVAK